MISQASSNDRGSTGRKKKPRTAMTTAVHKTLLVSRMKIKPSMIRLETREVTMRRHLKRRVPSAMTPSTPEPTMPKSKKRAPKRELLSFEFA